MAILRNFKSNILDMANWSKHHLGQLIILAGVIILFLVVCVLFSWFVGFYMNGFYGSAKFRARCYNLSSYAEAESLAEEFSSYGVTPSDLPLEIARQIAKSELNIKNIK